MKKDNNPKKPVLGKGLDAIFGDNFDELIKEIDSTHKTIKEVEINKIIASPNQPRRHFDVEKINELALSIKENGLISPIILKQNEGNKYYIVAGERRYRAFKNLGHKKIPSIIIDVSIKKMRQFALIENIQRENLNPVEEAIAISELINNYKLTHEATSKILGKSRTYITNSIRLLKLDSYIIDLVISNKISFGHAKPLMTLPKEYARKLIDQAVKEKWNVREVENYAKAYSLRLAKKLKPPKIINKSTEMERVEQLIRNKLMTKIVLTENKIIIKYKNTEQLNRILKRMDIIKNN